MLVLSRKPGEEILIGDHVRLVIHRIAGNRVALGIVAPKDVPVVRGELRLRGSPSEDATGSRA
jgi:carbon storage regulator